MEEVAEKPIEKSVSVASKQETKPQVENGVILLPEDTKENKIMNDIVRQMKCGTVDMVQLSNEREITSIAKFAYESIESVFNYIFKNIDFEKFSRENFNEIENILLTVKATIDNKIKIMEEKISSDETPKQVDENLSSAPKTYKEAAQLYGGIQQGHLPNRKNKEAIDDGFTEEQLVNALISAKTPVNVLDSIVPKQEFDIMSKTLLENVESCDYRIFDLHEVYKKMEKNDLDYTIEKFDGVIANIVELEEKIKKTVSDWKC